MTLLLTEISIFGIVFTADSRICRRDGNKYVRERDASKIFPIPYLNAAVGYFGCAYVGRQRMEDWLREFIRAHSFMTNLEEFASSLGQTINRSLSGQQKAEPLGFHISGYVSINGQLVPSFFFVWNFENLQGQGSIKILQRFRVEEHFLRRDVSGLSVDQIHQALRRGTLIYRNGWLNPYTGLASRLYDFFGEASAHATIIN